VSEAKNLCICLCRCTCPKLFTVIPKEAASTLASGVALAFGLSQASVLDLPNEPLPPVLSTRQGLRQEFDMNRFLKIWLTSQRWGCSIVGPILMGFGILWTVQTLVFLHHATQTEGSIVALTPYKGADNSIESAAIYQFYSSNGTRHTRQSSLRSNPPDFAVGDQVGILYRLDNPEDARIDTFMQLWFVPLIVGVVGTLASLSGVSLWARYRRNLMSTNQAA
jgi:hypothetical protein